MKQDNKIQMTKQNRKGWKNFEYFVWRTGGFSNWHGPDNLNFTVHKIDKVDRRVWFEIVKDRGEKVKRLSVESLNIKNKLSNTELRRRIFSNPVV